MGAPCQRNDSSWFTPVHAQRGCQPRLFSKSWPFHSSSTDSSLSNICVKYLCQHQHHHGHYQLHLPDCWPASSQMELQNLVSWETFSLEQVSPALAVWEVWVSGTRLTSGVDQWINTMFTADLQNTIQEKVFTPNLVYPFLQQLLICQRKTMKRQVRPRTWIVATKRHNTVTDHIRLRTLVSVQHHHTVFPFYLFIRYANVPFHARSGYRLGSSNAAALNR